MPRKPGPERPHRVDLSLTDDEYKALLRIRKQRKLTRAAALRFLILEEADRLAERKARAESARHWAGYVS